MPVWLVRLRLRARAMLSRSHDRELRDELQLHIDLLADEYHMQGMSMADAQARAHREFGNATRVQEASHDLFSFRALETLLKDLAYAIREMRRSPGFTAVAVLSLAVGIGAVTTAFAVLDAFVFRGLSLPAPDRLVAFSESDTAAWSRWRYATFRHWAESPDAPFDAVAIHTLSPIEESQVRGDGQPSSTVHISVVSGNYFDVLKVPMIAGRALTPSDDRRSAGQPVAVISEAFWDRRFGRASEAIGRGVELNGVLYEILGVARRDFTGDWVGQPTDIWLPLSMHRAIAGGQTNLATDQSQAKWLRVIARLKDTATTEQATAAANVLYQRFLAQQPAGPRVEPEGGERIALLSAARGYAPQRQRYAQPLMILTAIVALVLVVACANFTNLLLARSEARHREFAVRLALGAGRWRIIAQSLTECVLLASLAGTLGILISHWATTAVLKRFAATIEPIDLDLRFDARVLTFTAACVGVVILSGLWPCIRGPQSPTLQRLSKAAMREHRANRLTRTLLVGQLALCAVLMIGSGLMLRTITNLRSQWLGFERNVLLVTLAPGRAGYTGEAGSMLLERVRERLLAIRGIVSVSTSRSELLDYRAYWVESSERLSVDGMEPVAGVKWTSAEVGPGYFDTIGLPVVRGRAFDDGDFTPSSNVIVVNKTMASLLFGLQDPIGRRVGLTSTSPKLSIVGVVDDARQMSPRDHGIGVMYRPLHGTPPRVVLAVRTRGPAADATDLVHHQLQSMDQDLPLVSVRTIDELLDEAIAHERLIGTLATWLGVLIIVITCIGLHALVSYDVAQRTHEIGVRLALGATRGGVAWLVLRDCSGLVGLGLAVGVPLSLAAAQPLSSQLFGIRPGDPQTIASAVLLLVAVALVAALRPARSAARTDPVALLRADN